MRHRLRRLAALTTPDHRSLGLCKRSVADRARQGARSQSRPVMRPASFAPRATVGSKIDEATTARWGTLLHAAIRPSILIAARQRSSNVPCSFPQFRTKPVPDSCPLYAGRRPPSHQAPDGLVPGVEIAPGFDDTYG